MDTSSTQTALVPTVSFSLEKARENGKRIEIKKKSLYPDKCKYFLLIEKANDINVNNKQDEKNADDAEKNLINYIIIILYINNTTWYIFHISIRYSLKEGDRVDS